MLNVLEPFEASRWDASFTAEEQDRSLNALEQGRLLYFPRLPFILDDDEVRFLSPAWSDGLAKNISFDPQRGTLKGLKAGGPDIRVFHAMMTRYAAATRRLLESLLPSYRPFLEQARTSFRPCDISQRRETSYKQDDQLLHTDAFPSRPTAGGRILRVFTNVNPAGRDRAWRIGEPFETYASKFLSGVPGPWPGEARLLAALRITKGRRTPYDHVMLQLHDRVKRNRPYQDTAPQTRLTFPPGSSWVVFTDQVLHAAMAGQHAFEQTFHLPVTAQRRPALSPLKILERLSGKPLV
jgi:hypothetical protein